MLKTAARKQASATDALAQKAAARRWGRVVLEEDT
jgi:hypothetical protein